MKQTINVSEFMDGFSGSYKDNFSYEGKRALYDYLVQLEEDLGEEIEYDPIALCCDYTEERDISHILEQYDQTNGMTDEEARQWLEDRTTLIEFDGGVIYQQF